MRPPVSSPQLTLCGCLAALAISTAPAAAQTPDYRIVGQSFFALSVSNLEEAARWYSEVFEMSTIRTWYSPDGSLGLRMLRHGGLEVELVWHSDAVSRDSLPEPPSRPFMLRGIFKAGFYVSGIEALFDHLQSQGVETDQRVFVDRDMGVRFFVFRDPDGNAIQVFESCENCAGESTP